MSVSNDIHISLYKWILKKVIIITTKIVTTILVRLSLAAQLCNWSLHTLRWDMCLNGIAWSMFLKWSPLKVSKFASWVFPWRGKKKSQEALPSWIKCIVVVKILVQELSDFYCIFILGLLLISLAKIIEGCEQ